MDNANNISAAQGGSSYMGGMLKYIGRGITVTAEGAATVTSHKSGASSFFGEKIVSVCEPLKNWLPEPVQKWLPKGENVFACLPWVGTFGAGIAATAVGVFLYKSVSWYCQSCALEDQKQKLESQLTTNKEQLKALSVKEAQTAKQLSDIKEQNEQQVKDLQASFEKKLSDSNEKNEKYVLAQKEESDKSAQEIAKLTASNEDDKLKADQERLDLQQQLDKNKEELQKLMEKIDKNPRYNVNKDRVNNMGGAYSQGNQNELPSYDDFYNQGFGRGWGQDQGFTVPFPVIQLPVIIPMFQPEYTYPAFGYTVGCFW